MAMDFISGPTTTTTTATVPRSPDSDTDTPPHPPPSKRAHHHHHSVDSPHVSYKECLKNHAASIGGHALDGCCEFMPGPTANPTDPTSLTCAACGCHRNFHRRDPDDPTPLHHLIPTSAAARKPHSPPSASQLLLSLSGHTHSPSAPSDHDLIQTPTGMSGGADLAGGGAVVTGYYTGNSNERGQNGNLSQSSSNKKRFRTKFTQEQKEKMHEFSEKIGWKLKKGEEKLVEDFCKQVGVDRSVFKVWMHNNKHTSASVTPLTSPLTKDNKIIVDTSVNLHQPIRNDTKYNNALDIISSNNDDDDNNNTTTTTSSSNVVTGMNNCGGVLASGGIEFNFANGGAHAHAHAHGQEAKAQ